ncbi:pyocin knob domain-containing protein [Hafnia paralvei]|uniref:pyocin knob domain-containing protein n=3 Tax=Hafnia TaxID=568 RepID=UPI00207B6C4D|nr:pyocin knob domain-containing protein [Hafnia paralvei]
MFHLDNNSGVSSMPTPAAAQNTSPRWFTEGAGSVPPSWPGQDWYNIVQAELLAVLAAAGIAPDKSKLNQLALAIKAISNKDALLKVNLLSEIKTVGASAQKTAIDNLGLTQTVELAASALQKDKNLSDVPDKPKARKNLELGSSAVNDVVTSMTDTTTGRVPIVGWMGLGNAGYGGLPMGVTSQFLSYPSSADEVPANCAGFQAAYGKTRRAQIVINTMGEVFSRFSLSDDVLDKTTPWAKHFTTLKPPTAADVSAIPFFGKIPAGTNLNTLTSYGVWFNPSNANATLALNYPSTNAGSLQVLQDAGSTQIYTEYQSGSQFRRGFYAGTWSPWRIVYDSGYKPTPDDVNAIAQDGCRVAGFVNGSQDAPYMRHTASNSVVRLMTSSTADARYITAMRLGSRATTASQPFMFEVPTGCVITGLDVSGDSNASVVAYYRPIQIYLNGAWLTVGAA